MTRNDPLLSGSKAFQQKNNRMMSPVNRSTGLEHFQQKGGKGGEKGGAGRQEAGKASPGAHTHVENNQAAEGRCLERR